MDFRGWKKISEDNKTCTLEHPKGHKLTVALKGLASIHREQIKRLKMATGGAVARYADGTPDGAVASDDSADQNPSPPQGNTHITINNAPAGAPAPPLPPMAQATNPAAQLAKAPLQVVPPAPVQGAPNILPNGQPNPSAISKNAQLIPEAQKDIDIAQAKGEAQNLEQHNEALGQVMQDYQGRYNNLAGHVKDFSDYMQKNPIDPKHYQENMGAGAKTATAIGLFFGGLGVPFGGHNYALDFLNKQIDRDIEAQKSRADQQKTIYGAYKELYGEGKEALAATKATMLDIANNRQKIIAAQLGTPQAFQKSLALGNQLAIDKEKALREGATQLNALPGFNSNAPKGQGGQPMPKGNSQIPAGKTGGPGGTKKSESPDYQILSPGAQEKMNTIMKGYDPQWSPEKDKIFQQFTAAQQAEKLLNGATSGNGLKEILSQMDDAVKATGLYGHMHARLEDVDTSNLIGAAASAGAKLIPDTRSENRIRTLRSNLESRLATALNGIMTPTDIHKAVEDNVPKYNDSKEDIDFKEKQIINMIREAVRGSALVGPGLLKK